MLLSSLRDLMKYTAGLGISAVKLTGEDGEVAIEAVESVDKSVVIKGKFLKELKELEGTCGLSNLEWLTSYVNAYTQKSDALSVTRAEKTFRVESKNADGSTELDDEGKPVFVEKTEEIVTDFKFSRPAVKMKNEYRVMDRRMIPEQYTPVKMEWDVVIEPTQAAIELLATQASFGVERYFSVKTVENDEGTNDLVITLGENEQAGFVFHTGVTGQMNNPWSWEMNTVLSILKHSKSANCTLSFLDKGALQITLNTGLAEYNYIIPAKAGK